MISANAAASRSPVMRRLPPAAARRSHEARPRPRAATAPTSACQHGKTAEGSAAAYSGPGGFEGIGVALVLAPDGEASQR